MEALIILLLFGLGFSLYKTGLFDDFIDGLADNGEPYSSPSPTPVVHEHIITRIQKAMSDLEIARRERAAARRRYTSAQRSRLPELPPLTCGLIGEALAMDMWVEDATENGGVTLSCRKPDWAHLAVRVDAEYAFTLNRGQRVRIEGIIMDGDYDAFGNLLIWCSLGNIRLDGRHAETGISMIMNWGSVRAWRGDSPATGRMRPESQR